MTQWQLPTLHSCHGHIRIHNNVPSLLSPQLSTTKPIPIIIQYLIRTPRYYYTADITVLFHLPTSSTVVENTTKSEPPLPCPFHCLLFHQYHLNSVPIPANAASSAPAITDCHNLSDAAIIYKFFESVTQFPFPESLNSDHHHLHLLTDNPFPYCLPSTWWFSTDMRLSGASIPCCLIIYHLFTVISANSH